MSHQDFLRSLSPEQRAGLTAKSNAAGLRHLAGHLGVIILLAGLVAFAVPGWQILMLPLGIALVFLFTLLHEASHQTVFATKWPNAVCAIFAGFILFLPPRWFRYFHLAHHRFTHDPARDPELATPKPRTWPQYLHHLSGLPTWTAHARAMLTNALGRNRAAYVPDAQRARVARESQIMLGAYGLILLTSLALGSTLLIWIWLVPLLLGQPFLRLYLLAEHALCPHVADMFQNTRTTFTTRLVRFFAWNMPFHAEHHAFPSVPFCQLPRLHDLSREYLRATANGYCAFHVSYQAQLSRPSPADPPPAA